MPRIQSCLAPLLLTLASLVAVPAEAVVSTVRIASGLTNPVYATAAPGDDTRLFILEQTTGQIKILNRTTGTINPSPYLTIAGVSTVSEQGLLGLAFHPDYASNGHFYVNYTDAVGTTQVVRYTRSTADTANAGSALPILSITQPQNNHNGGWMDFGPNGYLYIGVGDGGNSYDQGSGHIEPGGNAQSLVTLLGKMLRIDVDNPSGGNNYGIPASNPYAGHATFRPEIWAYGLRNPWRSSFDADGNLWIGDVGQGSREEIDFEPAASLGGVNYGWRLREGTITTPGGVGGAAPGAVDPIYEYTHDSNDPVWGFSITGGYVYRGPIAELQGHYFFADYVRGQIWSFTYDGATVSNFTDRTAQFVPDVGSIGLISSFGEDNAGNLFIVDRGGEVFMVVPEPSTLLLFLTAAGLAIIGWRRSQRSHRS
jgi:glucose/arabinose dehydrogenase